MAPQPAVQLMGRDPIAMRRDESLASHAPTAPWPMERRFVVDGAAVLLEGAVIGATLALRPARGTVHRLDP